MQYKGENGKSRQLRRLWEVKVYDGNPDAKKTKTRKETVVAWNAVDAIRMCGGVAAEPPKAVCFVTWPKGDETGPIFRIESTAGPSDEEITPTIPMKE